MPKLQLSLDTIRELEFGAVAEQFDTLIERAVSDVLNRPHDRTARKVQLELQIRPSQHNEDEAEVSMEMKARIPAHRSRSYAMRLHAGGKLSFHPDVPDDPDAHTLFDEEGNDEQGDP